MAIFKECIDCKRFYFDSRYTAKCKDCRDKSKKYKCQYCSDDIEEGYTGFDEGMCEVCFDFYKEEEEEC